MKLLGTSSKEASSDINLINLVRHRGRYYRIIVEIKSHRFAILGKYNYQHPGGVERTTMI